MIAIHDPNGCLAAESRPRDEARAAAKHFKEPFFSDARKPVLTANAAIDELKAAEQRAHKAVIAAIPAGSFVEWADPKVAGRKIGTVFEHHCVRFRVMTPEDQGGSWFGDWIEVGWVSKVWLRTSKE